MNKREYCESRESVAYYSGLGGLEIKGAEWEDGEIYIYCVSGCWGGGWCNGKNTKRFHRCRVYYSSDYPNEKSNFLGYTGIKFRLMNVLEWGFNYEMAGRLCCW